MKRFNLLSFLGALALSLVPSWFSTMHAIANITGTTLATIVSDSTAVTVDGDEVLTIHKILKMAAQESPFADNFVGKIGSGKPICINTDTNRVLGNKVIIPVIERLGGPGVPQNTERVGREERRKVGDFTLPVDIMWFGVGITNTGMAQSILGANWDDVTQEDLALRLAKQQSDDTMITLRNLATGANLVVPNGKTVDTLGTADTYSYALCVKSGGRLRDLGARPVDMRVPVDQSLKRSTKIARHIQFTTDANARAIKTDSAYLQALQFALERGMSNHLFVGDYTDVDNQVLYNMQCIEHAGLGSIGCPLQPDALLGADITSASTTITAGGTGAAAAAPYPYYWENFSRFVWPAINATAQTGAPAGGTPLTGALVLRSTYLYFAIVSSLTGKILYGRGTGFTGGITGARTMTMTSHDFLGTATPIGDMVYGSGPYLSTADGLGFQGIIDGDSFTGSTECPSGSKIYEVNSKGVPIGYGLGLGEMAAVCGYGRVPIAGGGFKDMANRTKFVEPHNRNFAEGLEVSWGVTPFKRPGGGQPNFTLMVFSRKIDGFPIIP